MRPNHFRTLVDQTAPVRRRERNKRAAAKSRAKKVNSITDLSAKVTDLEQVRNSIPSLHRHLPPALQTHFPVSYIHDFLQKVVRYEVEKTMLADENRSLREQMAILTNKLCSMVPEGRQLSAGIVVAVASASAVMLNETQGEELTGRIRVGRASSVTGGDFWEVSRGVGPLPLCDLCVRVVCFVWAAGTDGSVRVCVCVFCVYYSGHWSS